MFGIHLEDGSTGKRVTIMNRYQFGNIDKIKVVIWDLDETFWIGTI